jgi:small subunit ribosomal protein S6
MRLYETAFLIAPNLPEEEMEKLIKQMADFVTKKKGKMVNQDNWGKKRLAYPILKFEEAFYVFFLYEAEADVSTELERRFKQTEAVIRYLTVRKEAADAVRKKGKRIPKTRETRYSPEKEMIEEAVEKEDTTQPELIEREEKVEEKKAEISEEKQEKEEKKEKEKKKVVTEEAEKKEADKEKKEAKDKKEDKDKEEVKEKKAAKEKKTKERKKESGETDEAPKKTPAEEKSKEEK